jgi:hypothetical protein
VSAGVPDGGRQMACGVCASPLNRYVDLDTGKVSYLHPFSARGTQPAHEPDPVPADQIDTDHVCDFCADRKIVYAYRVRPVETVVDGPGGRLIQHYGTDWSACIDCAHLLELRDERALLARIVRRGGFREQQVIDQLRLFLSDVFAGLQPGRTVMAIGRWQPVPLPAPSLPRVRDRLADLLRGPDYLPADLDNTDLRTRVADSLRTAHLYWIDPQFTDLAVHAAESLPARPVTAHPPAPHGLIAWAQPVGQRHDTVAATWTTGTDGIDVVGYRSVGAGLDGTSLQRLREQVGWLTPQQYRHLPAGAAGDAADPVVAIVMANWLLIAQKLAETVLSDVDRTIRRAYQRTGRPVPQVRLVRIRGTAQPTAGAGTPQRSGDAATVERTYRWWVRGHWRNQPYGPGRSQHRWIFIDPQLRGPDDKPIKASTTVRILGTRQPLPRTNDE